MTRLLPTVAPLLLTDDDLKAIFAYLRSIPPVKNRVPEAIIAPPPPDAPAQP